MANILRKHSDEQTAFPFKIGNLQDATDLTHGCVGETTAGTPCHHDSDQACRLEKCTAWTQEGYEWFLAHPEYFPNYELRGYILKYLGEEAWSALAQASTPALGTPHDHTNNDSTSPTSSVLNVDSSLVQSAQSVSDARPVALGLPIDYTPPKWPVRMSWHGHPERNRFKAGFHNYGSDFSSGRPNDGKLSLKKANLDRSEDKRMCFVNYSDPLHHCKYNYPVVENSVEIDKPCANNHGLTQLELNEMFYGRRISLARAKYIVACNQKQTRDFDEPKPAGYIPLHVPVAPPGYVEKGWVISVLPDEFEAIKASSGIPGDQLSCAPMNLRYAEEIVTSNAVHPLVEFC